MHVTLRLAGEAFDLYLVREEGKVRVEVDGETFEAVATAERDAYRVRVAGEEIVLLVPDDRTVVVDGEPLPFEVEEFRATGAPGAHEAGAPRGARIRPPMPGKIVAVKVAPGDEVKPGKVLLILEAMKMQNEIASPVAGTVKAVHAKPGSAVEAKDVLVEIE